MGSNEIKKRACKATNVRGEPCSAPHQMIGETGYCNVHDTTKPVSSLFLGSVAGPGSGRPSKMSEWKAKIDEDFDRVVKPLYDGLAARRSDADEPDHAIRLKASEAILDRVYGKSVQRSELSGPDGGAIPLWLQVVAPIEASVDAEVRESPRVGLSGSSEGNPSGEAS